MPELVQEGRRRLSTILAADIVGYSRMMGSNEVYTTALVKKHRRELIDPTVQEYSGRIVKNTGDGFLAEFQSPVEAVKCAIIIQQSMMNRNLSIDDPAFKIIFRIGINIGDIIVDTDDIYGDAVNVAVRLEGLAEPGDVYVSAGVYELVKNKLVIGYQALGEQRLKNITDPIKVFRLLPDPESVQRAKLTIGGTAQKPTGNSNALVAGGAAAAVVIAAAMLFSDHVSSVGDQAKILLGTLWPTAKTSSPPGPPSAQAPASVLPQAAPSQVPTMPKPAQQSVAVATPPRVPAASGLREPEMVKLAGGTFTMGSNDDPSEQPSHPVTIKPFLMGKYPVTVGQWKQCAAASVCSAAKTEDDDDVPVSNVSWNDAMQYATWLSHATNRAYRLPTEAEWEFAARGGTQTKYWWGNQMVAGMAYCRGCGDPSFNPRHAIKVGSFPPNGFGVYDISGGVAEWVADCWHKDYAGAPRNGSSWDAVDCQEHVLRGGSWMNDASYLRTSNRDKYDTNVRYPTHGFRIARDE